MKPASAPVAPTGKPRPVVIFIIFIKVLAPFIPVIIGGILKISLLDDVPERSEAQVQFFIASYAKPLWLQLLVSAYILPIAAIMYNETSRERLTALYITPAVGFVLCLCLFFGLPKIGIQSDVQILVVDAVAAACVIILGMILVNRN